LLRRVLDEAWVSDRGRIQRDLVGAGTKRPADVFQRPQAAPHRERDEDFARSTLDRVEQAVSPVKTRDDIHIEELVRTAFVVMPGETIRLAKDTKTFEVHAFHKIGALDVESRNNPHSPNFGLPNHSLPRSR